MKIIFAFGKLDLATFFTFFYCCASVERESEQNRNLVGIKRGANCAAEKLFKQLK
jgi:hypothetical protein